MTGRLKPPEGARFIGVGMGAAADRMVLSSSAGYGFIVELGDMMTKNKAGKACLTVPAGGAALLPAPVGAGADPQVAVVTSQGRLLVFGLTELPELARGKGVKLINIPAGRFQVRRRPPCGRRCRADRPRCAQGVRGTALPASEVQGSAKLPRRPCPAGFEAPSGFSAGRDDRSRTARLNAAAVIDFPVSEQAEPGRYRLARRCRPSPPIDCNRCLVGRSLQTANQRFCCNSATISGSGMSTNSG